MAVSKENVFNGNHGNPNPVFECCHLQMEAQTLGTLNKYLVLLL